jgi:hypothetical protein
VGIGSDDVLGAALWTVIIELGIFEASSVFFNVRFSQRLMFPDGNGALNGPRTTRRKGKQGL